ncbi:SPATA8 isoform 1 [Pan troglodytes]|uniref:SPATA8 isoform 1 n=2 Tax=Pan troglodytes TaxID=9598 RepID=A0A2J8L7C7_PANTR|nr:SPATA8 isoform 1 [Pan troglodytes]
MRLVLGEFLSIDLLILYLNIWTPALLLVHVPGCLLVLFLLPGMLSPETPTLPLGQSNSTVKEPTQNLVATFLRSHDMSLQLEAFQGWPRRPQGPGVACKGREQLFSRKDPKGSKAKGAICFPTDSEDKQEKCPVSPILLVLIFQ